MLACGILVGLAITMLGDPAPELPTAVPIAILGSSLVLLVVTAGIRQRWEIDYKGHRIRFENSPITAERLFLDEGLVARGGFGSRTELRAPIRVGDGAGEELVALVHAGVREFHLRLFVESAALDSTPAASVVSTTPPDASPPTLAAAVEDLQPVTESAVLGKMTVAKHVLEFMGL